MYKIALSAKDKRARSRSLEVLNELQRALASVMSCRVSESKYKGKDRAEKISRHAHTMARIEREAGRLTNATRPLIWSKGKKKRLSKPELRVKWHDYLMRHTKSEDVFVRETAWLEGQKDLLDMMHGGNTFIKLA